jgi:hypothetical protein
VDAVDEVDRRVRFGRAVGFPRIARGFGGGDEKRKKLLLLSSLSRQSAEVMVIWFDFLPISKGLKLCSSAGGENSTSNASMLSLPSPHLEFR